MRTNAPRKGVASAEAGVRCGSSQLDHVRASALLDGKSTKSYVDNYYK